MLYKNRVSKWNTFECTSGRKRGEENFPQ